MVDNRSHKVVLLGDSGVGKSTWVKRLLTASFDENHIPTTGVEVHSYTYHPMDGEELTFRLWDIAGLDRLNGLGDGYYINAEAAIIFYKLNSPSSYNHIPYWIQSFRRVIPDGPILIVGTGSDLADAEEIMDDITNVTISSLTGDNVEQVITELASL